MPALSSNRPVYGARNHRFVGITPPPAAVTASAEDIANATTWLMEDELRKEPWKHTEQRLGAWSSELPPSEGDYSPIDHTFFHRLTMN